MSNMEKQKQDEAVLDLIYRYYWNCGGDERSHRDNDLVREIRRILDVEESETTVPPVQV